MRQQASPREVAVHIGERIREARKARGFSQDTLARSAGVNRSWLGRIELGKARKKDKPSLAVLEKLAAAFDVDLAVLLQLPGSEVMLFEDSFVLEVGRCLQQRHFDADELGRILASVDAAASRNRKLELVQPPASPPPPAFRSRVRPDVGQLIRAARRQKLDISMEKFAELTGLTTETICHVENGVNCPVFQTLSSIARELGMPLESFLKPQ